MENETYNCNSDWRNDYIMDEGNGLTPHYGVYQLLFFIPQIKDRCDITGQMIMNIDSSNMTPNCWVKMPRAIKFVEIY